MRHRFASGLACAAALLLMAAAAPVVAEPAGGAAALKARFPRLQTLDNDDSILRWNAGQIELLAVHPASAGHGLNLQGQSRMVWMSLPWSLELYDGSGQLLGPLSVNTSDRFVEQRSNLLAAGEAEERRLSQLRDALADKLLRQIGFKIANMEPTASAPTE